MADAWKAYIDNLIATGFIKEAGIFSIEHGNAWSVSAGMTIEPAALVEVANYIRTGRAPPNYKGNVLSVATGTDTATAVFFGGYKFIILRHDAELCNSLQLRRGAKSEEESLQMKDEDKFNATVALTPIGVIVTFALPGDAMGRNCDMQTMKIRDYLENPSQG